MITDNDQFLIGATKVNDISYEWTLLPKMPPFFSPTDVTDSADGNCVLVTSAGLLAANCDHERGFICQKGIPS
jgi:hypothetical protein